MSIQIGSIVEGQVTGITNFGAFIELPGGIVGLVHISEVADTYVKDVKDFLKDKDKVTVKVISIDGKGKIGLSIKQAKPSEEKSAERSDFKPAYKPAYNKPRRQNSHQDFRRPPAPNFEDKLSKFLKDSDERQQALKKNTESKRGGRGGRRSF